MESVFSWKEEGGGVQDGASFSFGVSWAMPSAVVNVSFIIFSNLESTIIFTTSSALKLLL